MRSGGFQLAAYACLALLPLGMAIANRSAPAMLVLAALLSAAGRLRAGEAWGVLREIQTILLWPAGRVVLALLALAAMSLLWSHVPGPSLAAWGELVLPLAAAVILAASLPRDVPRPILALAAAAVALGCVWALGELATGVSTRAALGFRSQDYIFKRSVTSILTVAWPIVAFLWLSGWRWAAPVLFGLIFATIVAAHAGAALLGLLAGSSMFALAWWRDAAARALLAVLLAGALLLAPVFGQLAGQMLPERLIGALHSVQMSDRIDIWRSFGEVVRRRPILGAGFGTSGRMGTNPVAEEIPADRRVMLAVGHPHQGFLQVWAELGLVGAALSGALLLLFVRGVGRVPPSASAPAIAAVACSAAIMLVAHGAWQGWWIASLGASAIWFGRLAGYPAAAEPLKPVART